MGAKKEWLLKNAKNLIFIVLGTWALSLGTAIFIVPFDLVVGGMSGLALVIDALIPGEWISFEVVLTIVTWVLFFAGWIIMGRGFAMKTLISTIVYPIGTWIFGFLVDPNVLVGIFYLQSSVHSELALVIAAVGGGALIGIGCALTFLCGGSTGGVDIFAFAICKVFKRLKTSYVIFFVDASIIGMGLILNRDLVLSILGVFSAMVTALVIDKVFLGGTAGFVAQIVTTRHEEINRDVIEKMGRSTTILDAIGGYSQTPKKMMLVSFNMNEYSKLLQIIHACDRSAFVTIHKAHEINGEGWTR